MNPSPLLPLHRAAGARLTTADRGPSLLTYGDVPAEYRAGTEGCLVFDTCERGTLSVVGPDSPAFLQRITANQVLGLEPGQGSRNLLLTPKGKVSHDFDLRRLEDGFLLSTPPGEAGGLASALDTYLFTESVEFADVSQDHAPLELCGPGAGAALETLFGAPPPQTPHVTQELSFEGAPLPVTALPVVGSPGWRVDPGPERVEILWRALVEGGGRPAGLVAGDILRVEAGRAQWGRDVDPNVYPQEARLEEAFSLEKGCYIGQEVVAKIDTYGGLNKLLCGLRVDHDDPVPVGTRLVRQTGDDWRDLGLVTSWAYSFALDTGMVLGYVKRKHQATGTVFRLGEGPATATIVDLPVRAGALPVTGEQPVE